jgi:hypothetical protein
VTAHLPYHCSKDGREHFSSSLNKLRNFNPSWIIPFSVTANVSCVMAYLTKPGLFKDRHVKMEIQTHLVPFITARSHSCSFPETASD